MDYSQAEVPFQIRPERQHGSFRSSGSLVHQRAAAHVDDNHTVLYFGDGVCVNDMERGLHQRDIEDNNIAGFKDLILCLGADDMMLLKYRLRQESSPKPTKPNY